MLCNLSNKEGRTMENVIYDIYTRVNSKLQLNSNETLDAMIVASDIINDIYQ